jgi:general secretion pathway protein D
MLVAWCAAAAVAVTAAGAPGHGIAAPPATCRALPPGKRLVKLNLKPETDVADLLAWISSITCKQFILPGGIADSRKTVTIVSPQLMTREEAYALFLAALDSVGLAVYPTGNFLRVIETARAKTSPVPLILPGDAAPAADGNPDDAR